MGWWWGLFVAVAFLGLASVIVGIMMRQPLTVHLWIDGQDLSWAMGFQSQWMFWSVGDAWKIPRSPAAQSKPGVAFDPKRVHRGMNILSWYRRFVDRMWRETHIRTFEMSGALGLGEASDTGLLFGLIASAMGWWLSNRIAPQSAVLPTLKFEPIWDHAGFHGKLVTHFDVLPTAIVAAFWQSLWIQWAGSVPIMRRILKEV